jgi:hypothetical protein
MSLDANKALYQRYFAILLEKTPEKLDEVLAPNFVGHDLPQGFRRALKPSSAFAGWWIRRCPTRRVRWKH